MAGDLQAERVEVDVADVEQPHLVGIGGRHRSGGHLAELVDLAGQHLQPASHALQVPELALDRIHHRGGPLQRAGVPGLLEGVGPVAGPDQPQPTHRHQQRSRGPAVTGSSPTLAGGRPDTEAANRRDERHVRPPARPPLPRPR